MTLGPRPLWRIRQPAPAAGVRTLEQSLRLPSAVCRLLAVRDYATPEKAKSFLRPLVSDLHDPSLLKDGEGAARRIAGAVQKRELVLVHGDYDVDGIAGAALLTLWIRSLGGRAEAFIPHRLRDGYDLSEAGVAHARRIGAELLVTVDCGISAGDWVARAQEAGIDVVVTDHHQPGPVLPPALAVVNPSHEACRYPNKRLCGASVAFKVGQLTGRILGRPDDDAWQYLDLVALATLSDQVPLLGENRVLARFGLRLASTAPRPGVAALAAVSGTAASGSLDSADVTFRLAPRINAAGRMGEPSTALRLLMSDDPSEARAIAATLHDANRERRWIEGETVDQAMEKIADEYDPARDRAVVVAGDDWHPGVIGIVASRIVERLYCPVVVIALSGDRGRGSVRSIPSFDVHGAVATCARHLERFGGHPQAAGLEIRRQNVRDFRRAFLGAAREKIGRNSPRPVLTADLEIGLDEISGELFHYLQYMGPFGQGNPRPLFVARGVQLGGPPSVVGGSHVRFRMAQGKSVLRAFGPRLADRCAADRLGADSVDVAFSLASNYYRGNTTIEAHVRDIRLAC